MKIQQSVTIILMQIITLMILSFLDSPI